MDEKNAFNTDLDPEVIKIRDKIISKIGDKPLDIDFTEISIPFNTL